MTEKKQRFTIEVDDENFAQILDNNVQIGQYNVCKLLNELVDENMTEKQLLDLQEELDYYKSKCASLETGLFRLDRENKQLKTKNNAYLQDIEMFKEENTTLKLENEQLKQQKPFLKIHDDYFIQYGDDNELFNLHKPSDIRSLCRLINRENGYDELECEYNEEGYGND